MEREKDKMGKTPAFLLLRRSTNVHINVREKGGNGSVFSSKSKCALQSEM